MSELVSCLRGGWPEVVLSRSDNGSNALEKYASDSGAWMPGGLWPHVAGYGRKLRPLYNARPGPS